MNIYSLLPLSSFFIHSLLIAYVTALDHRNRSNRAFIIMAAFFALWALGAGITWNAPSAAFALAGERIHVPFWLFSAFAGLNFIYVTIQRRRGALFFILLGINLVFGIIGTVTPLIVAGVAKTTWGVTIVQGRLYMPAVLLANTSSAIVGIILLGKAVFSSKDTIIKKQLVCLFIGTVLMYGVVFGYNVVFRDMFQNMAAPSVGSFLLLIQSGFVFYAIRRFSFLRLGIAGVANELARQLHEGIVIVDPDNRIVDLNNAARAFLGIGNRNVTGNRLSSFFGDTYSPGNTYTNKEVRLPCGDGENIGLLSQSALYNSGIQVGMMVILRDITQHHIQEQRRKHVQEELKQSEQAKMEAIGRLAGGIAHDFNNMLGAMCGYADLICRKTESGNPQLNKYAHAIVDASKRASELTRKMLAFARKEHSKKVCCDIHEVIETSCSLVQHSIDKRIRVIKKLNAEQSTINGDNTQLQNVFLNLAINSRDALAHGGTIEISTENIAPDKEIRENISTEFADSYVVISVRDDGIGMDEETKNHVFEPFFTTKGAGKGTGLGLASAFGTIKSHRGTITLESEKNKGTCVTIYLPVCNEQRSEQEVVCSDTHQPLAHTCSAKRDTILIVDDEVLVRDYCAEMARTLGYKTTTKADGMYALDFFRQHHKQIALVILDLNMPRMHGWDCLCGLKGIDADAKVLVASGYSEEVTRREYSGTCFIQKPFTHDTLTKAMQELLVNTSHREPAE